MFLIYYHSVMSMSKIVVDDEKVASTNSKVASTAAAADSQQTFRVTHVDDGADEKKHTTCTHSQSGPAPGTEDCLPNDMSSIAACAHKPTASPSLVELCLGEYAKIVHERKTEENIVQCAESGKQLSVGEQLRRLPIDLVQRITFIVHSQYDWCEATITPLLHPETTEFSLCERPPSYVLGSRAVTLRPYCSVKMTLLPIVANSCPNLHTLDLSYLDGPTTGNCIRALGQLTQLQTLVMQHLSWLGEDYVLLCKQFPELRELDLAFSLHNCMYSETTIHDILKHCQNLTKLDVSGAAINVYYVVSGLLNQTPRLESLVVDGCVESDCGIANVPKSWLSVEFSSPSCLRRFSAVGCSSIDDSVIELLSVIAPGLTEVNVQGVPLSTEAAVAMMSVCRLSSLNIADCTLEQDVIGMIASTQQRLKSLDLSWNMIDDITPLMQACSFETLSLRCLDSIPQSSFAYLQGHTNLQHLNLSRCELDSVILQGIFENCRQLETVNVGWTPFNDDNFVCLCHHSCSTLRQLDAEGCKYVSDAGLAAALLSKHPPLNLRMLNLVYVDRATQEVLDCIVKNLPELIIIDYYGNIQWSPALKHRYDRFIVRDSDGYDY
jgi:Leucine-rich repeat (LRR) protein